MELFLNACKKDEVKNHDLTVRIFSSTCPCHCVLGDDVISGGRVSFIGQGNLKLTNVQLSDTGDYTCTATASGDNDQLPITMTASLEVVGE